MNSCLNKPCKSGYAYWEHPTEGKQQVDSHGAFRYLANLSVVIVKNYCDQSVI